MDFYAVVPGIRAVTGRKNLGNELHAGFFPDMAVVAIVGEEEIAIALEAGGQAGIGTEISGGFNAVVPGGHVEGAGAGPAVERLHTEVIVIFLGEDAVAVARFKDGHGDDGGGGDLGGCLDHHGLRYGGLQEAALAAVGGFENLGNTGGEAEDVGGGGILRGDEAGNLEIALFQFPALGEAVLERFPLLFEIAFGQSGREAGHPDEGEDGDGKKGQPKNVGDHQGSKKTQPERCFLVEGLFGHRLGQIDDLWHVKSLKNRMLASRWPQ